MECRKCGSCALRDRMPVENWTACTVCGFGERTHPRFDRYEKEPNFPVYEKEGSGAVISKQQKQEQQLRQQQQRQRQQQSEQPPASSEECVVHRPQRTLADYGVKSIKGTSLATGVHAEFTHGAVGAVSNKDFQGGYAAVGGPKQGLMVAGGQDKRTGDMGGLVHCQHQEGVSSHGCAILTKEKQQGHAIGLKVGEEVSLGSVSAVNTSSRTKGEVSLASGSHALGETKIGGVDFNLRTKNGVINEMSNGTQKIGVTAVSHQTSMGGVQVGLRADSGVGKGEVKLLGFGGGITAEKGLEISTPFLSFNLKKPW